MIGIIVIYSVVSIYIISMGYHLRRCIKDKRIAEDNLGKAVRNSYEDGYKKGFADGAQQGYHDCKREAEIVAHNKKNLRKKGIIK